jgi:hypothetical protein
MRDEADLQPGAAATVGGPAMRPPRDGREAAGSPRAPAGRGMAGVAGRLLGDRYGALLAALLLLTLPLVTPRVYASDEVQYFAYLHSWWFDRDLDFTNEYTHFITLYPDSLAGFKRTNLDRIASTGERLDTTTGLPLNFGPIGSALLWTPFYALGHLAALALQRVDPGVAADGYSAPYLWAVTVGSAVYAGLALLLLYRLAGRHVGRAPAFWAALGIWLGTPVVFYSHGAPAYSHAASIFAVTLFLVVWAATRPLAVRRAWQWAVLGLLAGLVVSVREQDGVIPAAAIGAELLLALPALLRERSMAALLRLAGRGALFLGAWLVALVPQLITYRILNGNFLPNNNVTQKLEYGAAVTAPLNAYLVVLSPEHGLIFWTPLVVPALIGLLWLWRRDPTLTLALLLGFLATWAVNALYSTGPTRGSFGARRFLNCTPVFFLGLAAAYAALRARRLAPLVPVLTALALWWNLGLIVQFSARLMNRQQLELGAILYNQVVTVPGQLLTIAQRLLLSRDTFFKN